MILLDASLLVAAWNQDEAHHEEARACFRRWSTGEEQVVIIDYIVAETLTVLVRRAGPGVVRTAGKALSARGASIVPGWPYFESALARFLAQPRRGLSLADCVLVEAAAEQGASIATYDQGIRRTAGVEAVP